ncbi:MAG: tetratricopeptide repeat-containing sensor histidine kinase [Flammeovirgaceae bacterium]
MKERIAVNIWISILLSCISVSILFGQHQMPAQQVGDLIGEAKKFKQNKDYEQALLTFLEAEKISKQDQNLNQLGDIQKWIGDVYQRKKQYKHAENYYHHALENYKQVQDYEKALKIYWNLGYLKERQKESDLAIQKYDSGRYILKIGDSLGLINPEKSKELQAAMLYNKAQCFRSLNRDAQTIVLYQEALKLCDAINDSACLARNWWGIGRSYKQIGYYDEAINYYLKVALYYEHHSKWETVDELYNSIGILYKELKDWERAFYYYHKSLIIRIRNENIREIGQSYNNFGNAHLELHQFDSAIFYLYKALKIKEEFANEKDLITTYQNIGRTYLRQNQLDSAEYYLFQSLQFDDREEYHGAFVTTYNDLALLYLEKKQFAKAKGYWDKAEQMALKIELASSIIDIYSTGIQLFEVIGKPKESLRLWEKKEALQDSLYREQRLAVQEVFHENQLNLEKEATQFAEEKATVEQQQKMIFIGSTVVLVFLSSVLVWLWMNNSKKKKLIQSLYDALNHRSRNDLQILAEEIAYRLDRKGTDLQEQSMYLQQTVRSLNLAYHVFSASNANNNEAIADYMKKLATGLQAGYGYKASKVELQIDIQPIRLELEPLTIVGYVLVELLTNIFKHAFEDDTKKPWVEIKMWETAGKVFLSVEDNGKGLPKELQVAQLESEGLQEMHSFAKQLKGNFYIQNTQQGCHALLEFPN